MSTMRLAAATIMRLFVSTAHAGDVHDNVTQSARWDLASDFAGNPVFSSYSSQLFAPPYIAAPQDQPLTMLGGNSL